MKNIQEYQEFAKAFLGILEEGYDLVLNDYEAVNYMLKYK